MKTDLPLAVGALVAAGFLAACAPSSSSPARPKVTRLSIATGGTGGVYYVYGGALARLISESVPGVEATAEVTSASIDNLKFLRDGKADIAFTLADTLKDASEGKGDFEDRPIDLRALAVLYTNVTHVVTKKGSGITRLTDLKGKVVSMGSAGSGTETVADRTHGPACSSGRLGAVWRKATPVQSRVVRRKPAPAGKRPVAGPRRDPRHFSVPQCAASF